MNPEPISVSFASQRFAANTKSIQYAPAGRHTVHATLGGVPHTITVTTDESTAELLNTQLQELLTASEEGRASRPYIDFDHEGKKAAGHPKRFYWDDGIRLELEWTTVGKNAVADSSYSYFSPEMMIARETGEIIGLPEVGSIGSLVNTPAFQSIERLAAAHVKELTQVKASLEEVTTERDRLAEEVKSLRESKYDSILKARQISGDQAETLLKTCMAQSDAEATVLLEAMEIPPLTYYPSGVPPVKKTYQEPLSEEDEAYQQHMKKVNARRKN